MDYLLVPDLNATVEIDPELKRLEFEMKMLDGYLKDPSYKGNAGDKLEVLKKNIEEYKASADPKPCLTIGYMPPAKHTEIGARHGAISTIDAYDDFMIKSVDIKRQIVAWGLRGWNFSNMELSFVKEKYRGKEYQLASDDCIAILEMKGWLIATANAILEFNSLSEEHKKK